MSAKGKELLRNKVDSRRSHWSFVVEAYNPLDLLVHGLNFEHMSTFNICVYRRIKKLVSLMRICICNI